MAPAIARDMLGYVITSQLCLLWLRPVCLYAAPSHDFRHGAGVFTSKSFFPLNTSRLQAPAFTVFSIEIIPRFPLGHAREQSRHCFGASPPRRYRAHAFVVGIYECGHVSEAGYDKLGITRGDQRAVSAARSDSAPEACGRPLSGEPHARYIANRIDLRAICSRGTSEGLVRYANQVEEPLRLRTELDLDHQKLCL